MSLPLLRQRWRDLLFVHWEVEPADLRKLVPQPLEIDTFEGRAFVGVVPFRVEGSRPPLLPPLPGVSSFLEVNARTYVRRGAEEPGVWFFSLDATSRFAVEGARALYHLPYFLARIELERRDGELTFDSQRALDGARCRTVWRPAGRERRSPPGSLEEFLIERYVLFAEHRGNLVRARVVHEPYPLRAVELVSVDEDLLARAGVPREVGAPFAHSSRGVDVTILAPRTVA
jgi:uncharacterized protein YqjF (DUF2071 family)